MSLGRWLHRRLDPELRAIERLRRQPPAGLLQPFPDTFDNRYPELFAALADRLRGIERPRVLSFGCSDGAELRSLRRYLPDADLIGIPFRIVTGRALKEGKVEVVQRATKQSQDISVESVGATIKEWVKGRG